MARAADRARRGFAAVPPGDRPCRYGRDVRPIRAPRPRSRCCPASTGAASLRRRGLARTRRRYVDAATVLSRRALDGTAWSSFRAPARRRHGRRRSAKRSSSMPAATISGTGRRRRFVRRFAVRQIVKGCRARGRLQQRDAFEVQALAQGPPGVAPRSRRGRIPASAVEPPSALDRPRPSRSLDRDDPLAAGTIGYGFVPTPRARHAAGERSVLSHPARRSRSAIAFLDGDWSSAQPARLVTDLRAERSPAMANGRALLGSDDRCDAVLRAQASRGEHDPAALRDRRTR